SQFFARRLHFSPDAKVTASCQNPSKSRLTHTQNCQTLTFATALK
ncbi:hypothetical protein M5D96_008495, partial [Drosophila gunungcola]